MIDLSNALPKPNILPMIMKESNRPLKSDTRYLLKIKEELEILLAREKELSRLKGRMVSIASHEFRTPLSSIQLSASTIEHYFDRLDRTRIFQHLKKIIMAVQQMTAILDDLLSLEKIESGKVSLRMKCFDLTSVSRDVLEEMQAMTKKGQQLFHRHHGLDTEVYLDQDLLRRCLTNLISNAIKYSPEGGIVELVTCITEQFMEVQVKDQGIGIPEKEQSRLFETFFRADNAKDIQGTGLGLNIVKRYVELMNGSVSFSSRENEGTVFMLRFPRLSGDLDQPIK
ncbi:sensor histidine kinase KdpD [Mucilaginibacter sp. OK268]|uniref:sensor histidine kinase n=1 Tax=Mucilaginibacter sp. OK268 TaxID=1881048 RepID=UPI0015A37A5A|nr:HAMP domain-containing sensor histidine kinase [Mucilaginibacter sp. OK268]